MSNRRILSLWFPRLGAERLLRDMDRGARIPLGVVGETSNTQVIVSVTLAASQLGVQQGQPLRDASAICADLVTRTQNKPAEAAFLSALRRWAGKFSPWVSEAAPDSLVVDITGCSHLFGGEDAMMQRIIQDCADMGVSAQVGIADTLGAAWALARYSGQVAEGHRSGDEIAQEARATRARAVKRRHWTRGGAAAPARAISAGHAANCIAPVGQTFAYLAPLPVAALRLPSEQVTQLNRLGLRSVDDLFQQPRAGLARRFGKGLVLRLDQATGAAPEPVSPAQVADHFATRMTLPDPIGLKEDVLAGLDRLLPPLCEKLKTQGRAARVLCLEAHRVDGDVAIVLVTLARSTVETDVIRPLFELKLDGLDAGYGFDLLRLVVTHHEALQMRQPVGHLEAGQEAKERLQDNTKMDDLIARLGARVGMENVLRVHPVESNIPEKTSKYIPAAWSEPARDWPLPPRPRPLLLWAPELVHAPDDPTPPEKFRWRRRDWVLKCATGPERIAPEWWLDDPQWRSGVRDYWVVTTHCGRQFWLFYAHGAATSSGWFCHGDFC